MKNDVWRQHIISDCHLAFGRENCFDISKKKYTTTINGKNSSECERKHLESDSHKKKRETRFYSS